MEITIHIQPMSYYAYLSQNKYRKYITSRGRKYKSIIEDKLSEYMMDKKEKFIKTEDIRVSLIFYHDNRRKNDVDNYGKCILDFMSGIIYEDDKQVCELHIYKGYDKENPRIEIKVDVVGDV